MMFEPLRASKVSLTFKVNTSVNLKALNSNFVKGLGLWLITILLTGFGAALMGSTAGEIAGAVGTVVG